MRCLVSVAIVLGACGGKVADGNDVTDPKSPAATGCDTVLVDCLGSLPTPLVHLELDGSLANTGTGPWSGFVAAGGLPTYEDGVLGEAASLTNEVTIALAGTANALAEASTRIVSFWIREVDGPTQYRAFASNRTFLHGLEVYRGIYTDRATHCYGAGHPVNGPGGCAPFEWRADYCWHHIVVRHAGAAAPVELYFDGRLGSVADLAPGDGNYDVFSGAADITLGDTAGTLGRSGRILLDDVRLFASDLDGDVIAATACMAR